MSFKYTPEQLDFLRSNRQLMTGNELTAAFNKQFGTDKNTIAIVGVCNKRKWSAGSCGRFTKGFVPWNAGTQGQGLTTANKTSFKKGQKPHSHKPVGSERICSRDGYTVVKIAEPHKWKHKHVVIWESKNGPVPAGFVVSFIDEDITNFDPENLELISRLALLRMNKNGLKKAPQTIKPVIRMLSKVEAGFYELRANQANG